jgi:hypothetical protein
VRASNESGAVVVVNGVLGRAVAVYVLHQTAAQRHVEHLEAAAHAQNRQVGGQRRPRQAQFQRVAPFVDLAFLRAQQAFIVLLGVDIAAAGEEQTVQLRYLLLGRQQGCLRRQQNRLPTGPGDGPPVVAHPAVEVDLVVAAGGDADAGRIVICHCWSSFG